MSRIGHIVHAHNMKTVEQNYMKVKKMGKAHRTPKKRIKNPGRVKCPYLSSTSRKTCMRMVKKGLDGEVSRFDIQHFCRGNPIYCYYFRSPQSKNR